MRTPGANRAQGRVKPTPSTIRDSYLHDRGLGLDCTSRIDLNVEAPDFFLLGMHSRHEVASRLSVVPIKAVSRF